GNALPHFSSFAEHHCAPVSFLAWRQLDLFVAEEPDMIAIGVKLRDLIPRFLAQKNGGERGIRTPDTRKGIHAFEARAFSHSAISPRPPVSFLFYQGSCWLRISPPISLN